MRASDGLARRRDEHDRSGTSSAAFYAAQLGRRAPLARVRYEKFNLPQLMIERMRTIFGEAPYLQKSLNGAALNCV
jgi:hypothetical protein